MLVVKKNCNLSASSSTSHRPWSRDCVTMPGCQTNSPAVRPQTYEPWENGKGDVAKGCLRNPEDSRLKTITLSKTLRHPFATYPFPFSQEPRSIWDFS